MFEVLACLHIFVDALFSLLESPPNHHALYNGRDFVLQGRFHTALGLQYYKGSPNSVSALTIQAGSGSTFFIHKWQNEGRGKQQHAELKMFRKRALEHFDNFTYVP